MLLIPITGKQVCIFEKKLFIMILNNIDTMLIYRLIRYVVWFLITDFQSFVSI